MAYGRLRRSGGRTITIRVQVPRSGGGRRSGGYSGRSRRSGGYSRGNVYGGSLYRPAPKRRGWF